MTPIALTPPLTEPVSLTEARLYLRLDQSEEDGLLGTLITAARLMIEAASGRMLVDQSWRIVLDDWPHGGEIRLPLSPVSAVSAARVYDSQGQAQTVSPTLLALDVVADPPVIRVLGTVPEPGRARSGIEIDIVAGYGPAAVDVPALLRQAVLRLAARWFELRGDVVGRDATTLPQGITALVAPFRRARI